MSVLKRIIDDNHDVDLFVLDFEGTEKPSSEQVEKFFEIIQLDKVIAINCSYYLSGLTKSYIKALNIRRIELCCALDENDSALKFSRANIKHEFITSFTLANKYKKILRWIINYSWKNVLYGILCEISEGRKDGKLHYLESSNIFINKYVNVKKLFLHPKYTEIISDELKTRYKQASGERRFSFGIDRFINEYSYVTKIYKLRGDPLFVNA